MNVHSLGVNLHSLCDPSYKQASWQAALSRPIRQIEECAKDLDECDLRRYSGKNELAFTSREW